MKNNFILIFILILTNLSLHSQELISCNPCPPPTDNSEIANPDAYNFTVFAGTYGATITTPTTGPYTIDNTGATLVVSGTLTVDHDLIISHLINFTFQPNAKIVVLQGVTLTITDSHLYAYCDCMWQGIFVSQPSQSLILDKDEIEDAYYGVYCGFGTSHTVYCTDSWFHNDLIDMYFEQGDDPLYLTSTIFDCTPPLKYYNGWNNSNEKTRIGIWAQGVDTITAGISTSTLRNSFNNLDYGIVDDICGFHVSGSDFLNIVDYPAHGFSQYGTNVGIAVYSQSSVPTSYCSLRVDGNNNSNANTFSACTTGIFTNTGSTSVIVGNNFDDCRNGVVVEQCINKMITISFNYMNNCKNGIRSHINNYSKIFIIGNQLQQYPTSTFQTQGIFISEGGITSPTVSITQNELYGAYKGINCKNDYHLTINENTIDLDPNLNNWTGNLDAFGIRVVNSQNAQVTANVINGFGQLFGLTKGIDMHRSAFALLRCNDVIGLDWGICNRGVSLPEKWKMNDLQDCTDAFVLYNSGLIGMQGTPPPHAQPFDNRFFGSFTNHFYSLNDNFGNLNLFKLRANNSSDYRPNPVLLSTNNSSAILWMDVNPIHGPTTCSSTPDIDVFPSIEELETIAKYDSSSFDDDSYWWLKEELFEYLMTHNQYRDSSETLRTFYDSIAVHQGSLVQYLTSIYGITDPDSLAEYQDEINAAINTDLQNSNLAFYLSVALHAVDSSGFYTFTNAQKDTLFYIASQCPDAGGTAVYLARSLYDLAVDSVETIFEDRCIDSTGFIRQSAPCNILFSIYPTLLSSHDVLNVKSSENGLITIENIMGQVIFNYSIEKGETNFGLPVSLSQGIYIYNVVFETGMLLFGKLFVSK